MMTSSRRFQPVKRVTEQRERKAATQLADCLKARQEAEHKLKELEDYYQDYLERFNQASRNGIGAARVREYQLFLDKLEEAIKEQRQAVQRAQQDCDSAQGNWRQKHTRSRVMDSVMDRLKEDERKAENKKEQAQLDERNQRKRS